MLSEISLVVGADGCNKLPRFPKRSRIDCSTGSTAVDGCWVVMRRFLVVGGLVKGTSVADVGVTQEAGGALSDLGGRASEVDLSEVVGVGEEDSRVEGSRFV